LKFLLDTNVILEAIKPECDQGVKSFLETARWEDMYLSSVTLGEISYGIEKLSDSKKKRELSIWFYAKIPGWFEKRIIAGDAEILMECGRLRARTKRTLPAIDSLIAATAICHNMLLVTRNTKDFDDIEGINLLNPWELIT